LFRTLWHPSRLPLVAMAVLAATLVAYETDPLPWANSDSVEYVVSARNLIQGKGLGLFQASGDFSPIAHFPPLYPLLLSSAALVGADPLLGARWLSAAAFAIYVLLVGLSAQHFLGSRLLGLAVGAVMLTSARLVYLFGGAISESVFLPLAFGSTILALLYAERTGRTLLVAAAATASLAAMTRYAGLSLALSGPLILVLLSRQPLSRRLLDSMALAFMSVLPVAVWTFYARTAYHSGPPREVSIIVDGLWDRLQGFRGAMVGTLWSMVPFAEVWPPLRYLAKLTLIVLAVGAASVAVGLFLHRSRRRAGPDPRDRPARLVAGLTIFALSYITGLAVASASTVPAPDVDFRMLSPLLAALWLSLMGLGAFSGRRGVIALAFGLSLFAVIQNVPATRSSVARLHESGDGYTSLVWRSSSVIEAVRDLPSDVALISNESAALLLWTQRPAFDIPELQRERGRDTFRAFGLEPEDPIETRFRTQGSALVIFPSIIRQLRPLYGLRTEERLDSLTHGLNVFAELPDGVIYFYPR